MATATEDPPVQPATTPATAPASPPTPPPPDKPTTPAAPPKESLSETLKDAAFWENFPHGHKEKKKPAEPDHNAPASPTKPPETPPVTTPATAAAPAAPAATPPPTPEPPTPRKPKAVKKSATLDTERVVAIATEAATKAAAEAGRHTPTAPATPATTTADPAALIASLPEDDQADAEVYLEMQRLHPDKHGRLLQDLADYARKETEYSRKWQRENPDADFDPDDPKHDAFYDDNKPKFSKREFKEAERSLIRRQARDEIKAELQPQLDQFEMQRREDAIVPEVLNSSKAVLRSALVGINKDYEKYADKPQELTELAKTDPVATDTIVALLNEWHPVVEEVVKIYSGATKFNDRNKIHMRIFEISSYYDDYKSKRPLEERMDDQGRLFATREQYFSLPPAEQKKRWYLDKDKMLEIITGAANEDAAKIYAGEQERLERFAKARGFKTDASATTPAITTPANGAPPNPPAPAPPAPPPTPTVGGKTTLSADRPGATAPSSTWLDGFGFGLRGK